MRNVALLTVTLRQARPERTRLPIHGLIILQGPAGTGKSTLARGLAWELETQLAEAVQLIELDPHQLTSEMLGQSQRMVVQVLHDEVPAIAAAGLTVLVIDEVEAFAIGRSVASLETNPADVHRATDAVLAGIDRLSEQCPRLLVVATTNFPQGVDTALVSRADLVMDLPRPSSEAIREILADTVRALAAIAPAVAPVAENDLLSKVASMLVGLDGRQVRKFVVDALASDVELVLDPGKLTAQRLLDVATAQRDLWAMQLPIGPVDQSAT